MSDQPLSNPPSPSGSPSDNAVQPAASPPSQQSPANNQQNSAPAAPTRPAYALDSEWDATAGKLNDKFAERVNRLTAFEAEQSVRKNTLPKSEADYQVKLPASFQAPEGVKFEFDMNDPALAQARKIALARGVDQETFSDMLGVFAATKIADHTNAAKAREANIAQLGAAGPQRIEAVATWLQARAGDDGKHVADFLRKFPSAAIVKAMESLIKQFSSQGGTDFSQQHRETVDANAGKIPGYENMSFAQRRAAQMSERMKTDPAYARGINGR